MRFNLQKSGYTVSENSEIFAGTFGETKEFIEEALRQYDEVNSQSANEIKENTKDIDLSFLEGKKIMLTGDSNTSDRLSWGKVLEKSLTLSGYRLRCFWVEKRAALKQY